MYWSDNKIFTLNDKYVGEYYSRSGRDDEWIALLEKEEQSYYVPFFSQQSAIDWLEEMAILIENEYLISDNVQV